tara:strand:+ start:81 stop:1004 length:924 start_codon:yes stop_codon:yes gene_type:complete
MATTLTVNSSFSGQDAGVIISKALLSGATLDANLITVKPNIKYKEVIQRMETGDLLQVDSCDFSASSAVTMDERVIELKAVKVNLQLCKSAFLADWQAISMGDSANKNFPKGVSDYLIAEMQKKIAAEVEVEIYQGDGTGSSIEGFEALFAADATVIDVAATGITAGNVIAELGKVHAAIPAEILMADDLFLYVSQDIASKYVTALGGFGSAGLGANGVQGLGTQWYNNGSLSFNGVKMVVSKGLSQTKMFAATKSNLYYGTALLADDNTIKVIDMSDIDGSDNVRFIARMQHSVQYGYGAEVVYYS